MHFVHDHCRFDDTAAEDDEERILKALAMEDDKEDLDVPQGVDGILLDSENTHLSLMETKHSISS